LARVPQAPPSTYAIEGTNAHAVLEAALRHRIRDAREAHRDYSCLFDVDLDDGTNEFYLVD
jgi:acyl transferase domain-containing protein